MSEKPLVSIMLVNWNTRDMTLDCLRSVYEQTSDIPFEVIIVDNGSEDGSAEAIAKEFPQAILMAEKENHGFAKATNISVERAKGEYVLLLNTDTVVLDRAIERLVAFAKANPEARIWGGRTVFEDGVLNPASVFGEITPWSAFCLGTGLTSAFKGSSLFNSEGYGNWKRDVPRQIDGVQGSFLLIERELWNTLEGFDLEFFMYCEEADLCARARNQYGAAPKMTPDATIIHYGGRSTKQAARKIIYIAGGRIGLINRHFAQRWKRFGVWMTILWVWWRKSTYGLAKLVSNKYAEPAAEWKSAWDRRSLWLDGPPQTYV